MKTHIGKIAKTRHSVLSNTLAVSMADLSVLTLLAKHPERFKQRNLSAFLVGHASRRIGRALLCGDVSILGNDAERSVFEEFKKTIVANRGRRSGLTVHLGSRRSTLAHRVDYRKMIAADQVISERYARVAEKYVKIAS